MLKTYLFPTPQDSFMEELPSDKLPSPKEIVKLGKISIRVKHAGIIQRFEFMVKRKPGPAGEYPCLFLDKFIDLSELVRISEESGLPVTAKNGSAFPKGKMASDFAQLLK